MLSRMANGFSSPPLWEAKSRFSDQIANIEYSPENELALVAPPRPPGASRIPINLRGPVSWFTLQKWQRARWRCHLRLRRGRELFSYISKFVAANILYTKEITGILEGEMTSLRSGTGVEPFAPANNYAEFSRDVETLVDI
jgi:hypothetical protein